MMRPHRGDLIALFGETSGLRSLKRSYRLMLAHKEGSTVLADRPIIRSNTLDMDYLRRLPKNTFGWHYADFMDGYGYTADDRCLVNFVDDEDLAYVVRRYREVHDLIHVLLGQKTNMLGEVVVKWVEGLQLGLPLGLLGGFFGALRLAPIQTQHFLKAHCDYAMHVGLYSETLSFVYWERYWEMDIDELRKRLNVPAPPPLWIKSGKSTSQISTTHLSSA